MALDQVSNVRLWATVPPEGDMDVWTTFHGNPSNTCWDISLKMKTVNLMLVLKHIGSQKSLRYILRGPRLPVRMFVPIFPVNIKIFQRIIENFNQVGALVEKSGDHHSQQDLSFGHHGYLSQMSWQSIPYMLFHLPSPPLPHIQIQSHAPPKSKMATTKMSNSRLQNGNP